MYERELKERQPDKRELVYDIRELHAYLDHMADIVALVYALPICVSFALGIGANGAKRAA